MSSKTKILVLKSRNLVWTAVIIVIIMLLTILLVSALHLKNEPSLPSPVKESVSGSIGEAAAYIPGSYSSTLTLGSDSVNIIVCVNKNRITSITAKNLADTTAVMYPLVPSVLESLESQILAEQSLQGVSYADSAQYTASMLLDAISHALSHAYSAT